jgi:hypothetical protein
MALRGAGTPTIPTKPTKATRAPRATRATHAILTGVAIMACAAGPATAATIVVTPGSPHPGQKVHISVNGCSTGPTAHTATSQAFTGDVTLYGKADTGDADPMIRPDLKPGTYPITAHCGTKNVQGQISVTADDRPSAGHDERMNNWLLLVVAVVIAGVASAFLLGRRRRNLS